MYFSHYTMVGNERRAKLGTILSAVRHSRGLKITFKPKDAIPGLVSIEKKQTINISNREIVVVDFDGEDMMLLENASDALIETLYQKLMKAALKK